jgi:hypothetical protein
MPPDNNLKLVQNNFCSVSKILWPLFDVIFYTLLSALIIMGVVDPVLIQTIAVITTAELTPTKAIKLIMMPMGMILMHMDTVTLHTMSTLKVNCVFVFQCFSLCMLKWYENVDLIYLKQIQLLYFACSNKKTTTKYCDS